MKQIVSKKNLLKVAEIALSIGIITAPVLGYAALSDTFNCDRQFQNCNATNVNSLIRLAVNWLLGIAFGVAVLFLIIGGFWYITSAGNEETAEKGKNTAINAIIGIVIIILSWVIINVVANLVTNTNAAPPPA